MPIPWPLFPEARPRIISDNGPQYVSRDFRDFIRFSGMTHVRTSPYYPQFNGKIERFHGSLKRECIRPRTPVSLADARGLVGQFIDHYNGQRLHSAIGYVTPLDKLEGRAPALLEERQRKLAAARVRREGHLAELDRAGSVATEAGPAAGLPLGLIEGLDEEHRVGQYG